MKQGRTQRVQIESNGSILQGWLFLAGPAEPGPTAVFVPGWPGNPDDVHGLGEFLSERGINVLIFNPRGLHASEGISTFAHTMDDISAVLRWVRLQANSYALNVDQLVLGGYSYGGGLSLAYAARDESVRHLISIAGTDHAQFIRQYERDADFSLMVDQALSGSSAPEGPARFDIAAGLNELFENQNIYGLQENAAALADRHLLLIGGWEDENVTVDNTLLPFYRALRSNGAGDVTFQVYHDDHEFSRAGGEMRAAIAKWITEQTGAGS